MARRGSAAAIVARGSRFQVIRRRGLKGEMGLTTQKLTLKSSHGATKSVEAQCPCGLGGGLQPGSYPRAAETGYSATSDRRVPIVRRWRGSRWRLLSHVNVPRSAL